MRKTVLGLTIFIWSLANVNAYADTSLLKKIAEADIGYGEYLAGECVTCHKKAGSSAGIPSIAGIDAKTFVSKINGYKNKTLKNEVMQMMAGRLDEEQILSLAAYFSSLKPN